MQLRLVLGIFATMPLVANVVAGRLGYRVFLLADPLLQLFWATLVQIGLGLPVYLAAVRQREARPKGAVPVSLAGGALYGYSLYRTLLGEWNDPGDLHYELSAALLLLGAFLIAGSNPRNHTPHKVPGPDM